MTVDTHLLTPGCVVLIVAFDDIPEHQFQVEEVFDDLVTGIALTGPLAWEYGEPELGMIVQVIPKGTPSDS